jgi:hypothetical protein
VGRTVLGSGVCEFATTTAAGLPIDTPLVCAVDPGSDRVGVTTGLAYPVKAERARARPRVGLLFEAPDGGPVVSVAALAAVLDADIQANAVRYARTFRPMVDRLAAGRPWSALKGAYWYWARIYMECVPVRVEWWPSADATDDAPQVWESPSPVEPPVSDPAPKGRPTPAPGWQPAADWRTRAEELAVAQRPPCLSVTDADGFPRPIRLRAARPAGDGFDLEIPAGAAWAHVTEAPATLCYDGRATFAGTVAGDRFTTERMLPDLPLVVDPGLIFEPTPEVRERLVSRIHTELDRRGQRPPVMPDAQP